MQFENQFTKPWYAYSDTNSEPLNAKAASYVVGTGDNTLTIKYGTLTEGNGFTFEAKVATAASTAMSVAFASGALVVTLGTDDTVEPITADDTLNTYALIAAEINEIDGFTATVTGTGVIAAAIVEDEFTDGQEGTVCPVTGTLIEKSATEWYVNIAPNDKYGSNWRKLTVATY